MHAKNTLTLAKLPRHIATLTALTSLFYSIGITGTATYYVSNKQEINIPIQHAQWWSHPKIHQIASKILNFRTVCDGVIICQK